MYKVLHTYHMHFSCIYFLLIQLQKQLCYKRTCKKVKIRTASKKTQDPNTKSPIVLLISTQSVFTILQRRASRQNNVPIRGTMQGFHRNHNRHKKCQKYPRHCWQRLYDSKAICGYWDRLTRDNLSTDLEFCEEKAREKGSYLQMKSHRVRHNRIR